MSMNPAYQSFCDEVKDLQFRVQDALDAPSDPAAQQLHHHLEHLEDELEQGKSPRDVEGCIKEVQSKLLEARSHQGGFMSVDDADHFFRIFEDMRRAVRALPNY